MKKFTIDVARYPFTYEVTADTEAEAIAEAHKQFYSETDGASVYETEVTGVECDGVHDSVEDIIACKDCDKLLQGGTELAK